MNLMNQRNGGANHFATANSPMAGSINDRDINVSPYQDGD
jgi:hypothetical protein|tara:strand:+ start:928 stop:1047 length:120 start_codon:yes stop_codon:yes gene_type:complete